MAPIPIKFHIKQNRRKKNIMQLAMIGLGRMGGNMAKRIAAARTTFCASSPPCAPSSAATSPRSTKSPPTESALNVRFCRNGQTGPKNISPTVRFTGNGHPNTKNQPMNVRFCRNGHSTQLKNAYLAYIWQTSSAKQHFGGTFLAVLANRPAIYKRDSAGQGCVSAIYKADTHPFGLFASEFLQRAHTGLSGRRLRARTFRMRR